MADAQGPHFFQPSDYLFLTRFHIFLTLLCLSSFSAPVQTVLHIMWEFLFNRDDTNSIQDKNDLIPPTELYKRPPNSFQHQIPKIFCGLQQVIEEKHRLLVLSLTFQIKYTQDRDAGIYECQVIKTNRNLNANAYLCRNDVWNLIINTKGLNFTGPNLKKSPAQCHLSWSLYSGTTLGKYGIKLWGFSKNMGLKVMIPWNIYENIIKHHHSMSFN